MENMLMKYLKRPRVILIATLILTGMFFVVMKNNAHMETNLDKYMPEKHPAFVYSNQAESWFDIKDGIIIAIENKEGIYNTETLAKVKTLTKKLQKMKEIEKSDVTSLYTADNIIGTADGMDVKTFYKKTPKSAEKLQQLKDNVHNNDMIHGRLVSLDDTVTIVIARINGDVFTQEFYHNILNLTKEFEGPEKVYVAGRPIVEGTLAYLGPRDMKRMVPLVIGIIILVLYGVLRNIKSTFLTMLVVLFSTIWTFVLMAALNIPIYSVSTMIPVMLIAIGVADGIHLFSHLTLYQKEHPESDTKSAVRDMIKEMWKPVMMTSVTTAVGFISLVTSQVYPIKYFGIFTAFGVLAAMIFSLLLIPAGLLVFGLPKVKKNKKSHKNAKAPFSYRFAEGVIKHKWIVTTITILILFVSILGISKVWINSSFLDKFEKDSEIVLTDKFINNNFGGTNTLNVIFEGKNQDDFKNPKFLKLIDKVQQEVETSLDVVGSSFSLTDYIKRMNKVMHADKEQFNTIPDSTNLIAQYLLLYEMSGDPENLWQVVSEDYQKANLTFQLRGDDSKTLNSALDIVEKYRADFEATGIEVNYAGSGYKALVFTDLILQGQISSLILSFIIVIVLLAIMFGSITIGLIGVSPILITAAVNFGLMGILNIPLSTTTALISSIAVGIGIDYAVHFIERYKIYALKTTNKAETIRLTMSHSGRAIIFNAIVVIAGFLVLLFSAFPPNRSLGMMVSLNMFTSFLGTVTIMLIILYVTDIFFKKKK